eukprot:2286432-Rhodomonas_salina.1
MFRGGGAGHDAATVGVEERSVRRGVNAPYRRAPFVRGALPPTRIPTAKQYCQLPILLRVSRLGTDIGYDTTRLSPDLRYGATSLSTDLRYGATSASTHPPLALSTLPSLLGTSPPILLRAPYAPPTHCPVLISLLRAPYPPTHPLRTVRY